AENRAQAEALEHRHRHHRGEQEYQREFESARMHGGLPRGLCRNGKGRHGVPFSFRGFRRSHKQGGGLGQRFIEAKNSSLDLVLFILSSRNSIAPISSMPCSSLRRIQIFCSSSGSISRSSRRVPERLMS